jgi:ABC-type dipeptide/oligopeptide/nickel transport system ATPase subunit
MATESNQSTGSSRRFEDKPAVRERVPLLLGLVGPSGGGKTYSALRLATGIQKATGGDIYFIDTEARRALHYADRFKFRHLAFGAPFGPLDYLAAVEHCVSKGAKTIIVDSMSHEHEGPGGVLEMHDAEVQRMAKGDYKKAERVKMLAWQKPKMARRRLINSILQLPCNFIFCFRAKEKVKIVPGQEPKALGWMPIAGEEFVFEMTLNGLLLPGAGGVPTWHTDEIGEKKMIKLPEQFRSMFSRQQPFNEELGEEMAKWAAGTAIDGLYSELRDAIAMSESDDALKIVWPRIKAVADEKSLPATQYQALVDTFKDRRRSLAEAEKRRAELAAAGEVAADDEPPISTDEPAAVTGTDG